MRRSLSSLAVLAVVLGLAAAVQPAAATPTTSLAKLRDALRTGQLGRTHGTAAGLRVHDPEGRPAVHRPGRHRGEELEAADGHHRPDRLRPGRARARLQPAGQLGGQHEHGRDRRHRRLPEPRGRPRHLPQPVRAAAVHDGQRLPEDRRLPRQGGAQAEAVAGRRRGGVRGRDGAGRADGLGRLPDLQDRHGADPDEPDASCSPRRPAAAGPARPGLRHGGQGSGEARRVRGEHELRAAERQPGASAAAGRAGDRAAPPGRRDPRVVRRQRLHRAADVPGRGPLGHLGRRGQPDDERRRADVLDVRVGLDVHLVRLHDAAVGRGGQRLRHRTRRRRWASRPRWRRTATTTARSRTSRPTPTRSPASRSTTRTGRTPAGRAGIWSSAGRARRRRGWPACTRAPARPASTGRTRCTPPRPARSPTWSAARTRRTGRARRTRPRCATASRDGTAPPASACRTGSGAF